MNRLITGIIVALLGMMAFIGSLANPDATGAAKSGGAISGCLMMIGGGLLIYFGLRFISRRRTTIKQALQMLRESGGVDAGELADRIDANEVQVAKFLNYGRDKGILRDFGRSGRDSAGRILTMEDILRMLQSGLSEGTIIERIRSSGVAVLSIDGMVEWRDKGISEAIIQECVRMEETPEVIQALARKSPEFILPQVKFNSGFMDWHLSGMGRIWCYSDCLILQGMITKRGWGLFFLRLLAALPAATIIGIPLTAVLFSAILRARKKPHGIMIPKEDVLSLYDVADEFRLVYEAEHGRKKVKIQKVQGFTVKFDADRSRLKAYLS